MAYEYGMAAFIMAAYSMALEYEIYGNIHGIIYGNRAIWMTGC